MRLNDFDYIEIASMVETGKWSLEYEKDNETLSMEYQYDERGYHEDDYNCGTGAFVVTDRNLNVIYVESYDDNGHVTENDFNQKTLLSFIKNYN